MIDVLSKLKNSRKTVIWGAGYNTEEVLRFNRDIFERTELIIVDKYKAGQKILGADIQEVDSISFEDVDLVIILTGLGMDSIVTQLREKLHYNKEFIGLYEFRQQIASLNGNTACKYHVQKFITHMENGTEIYSYDTIFKTKFSHYRVIKVFAYWASSIGESIRGLLSYYFREYANRKPDEYYLLIPFINGNEFANGSFIEILSREIPIVTAENCHFWQYAMENYGERFDYSGYNSENDMLLDCWNPFDNMRCRMDMYNRRVDLLRYNKAEIAFGDSEIKRMGIVGQYVCIFARDCQYDSHHYNYNSHFSYFKQGMRNMDIRDFKKAVDYLNLQGIRSVRMGREVVNRCEMDNCIDYASKYHQDFLDLYLISKCKFFAGSLSGIVELAHLQNKPVLIIGLSQFGIMYAINYHEEDLYIPKKVYDKKAGRYLTLQEMLDVEIAAGKQMAEYYEEHDLVFVDPTQQEICDAVMEMNQKLDHTYKADKEAEALAEKYFEEWEDWLRTRGYKEAESFFGNKLRICDCYLKNNQYLLGS